MLYFKKQPEIPEIVTVISGKRNENPFLLEKNKAKIIKKKTFKIIEIKLDKLAITGVLDSIIGKIKNNIKHSIANGINFFII